jgi:hypothetical protein
MTSTHVCARPLGNKALVKKHLGNKNPEKVLEKKYSDLKFQTN